MQNPKLVEYFVNCQGRSDQDSDDDSHTTFGDPPTTTQSSRKGTKQLSQRGRSESQNSRRVSRSTSRSNSPDSRRSQSLLPLEDAQVGHNDMPSPPPTKEQLREEKKRRKALEAELANVEAQKKDLAQEVARQKRKDSPTDQVKVASAIKRARKGKKKLPPSSDDEDEPTLKPTIDLINKAIQEHVFAIVKFVKGPKSLEKLASHCILYSGLKMKKRERKKWYDMFNKHCSNGLNTHRGNVQMAIKDAFWAFWKTHNKNIGDVQRWLRCMVRDLSMDNDQDKADYSFYYQTLMAKATGTEERWNRFHIGYMPLYKAKPPKKDCKEIDYYVTPETEALTLLFIDGNWDKWRAQFQVKDMYPLFNNKMVPKGLRNDGKGGISPADVEASNKIKEKIYRERHGVDDLEDLPEDWMKTMQLPWESFEGSTNVVRLYVYIAHIFDPICP